MVDKVLYNMVVLYGHEKNELPKESLFSALSGIAYVTSALVVKALLSVMQLLRTHKIYQLLVAEALYF